MEDRAVQNADERERLVKLADDPSTPPNAALVALRALREMDQNTIRAAVDILNNSRHAFRSKMIERARKLLEELL